MVILWLTSPRAQHLRHMDIRQLLYHAILARKRAHAYMHVAASLPEAACGGRGGGYTQGGRDAERAVRTRCPVHRPAARVSCEVASGTSPITCTKSHRRWMCGGNRASRSRDTALASRLRRCRVPVERVAAHGAQAGHGGGRTWRVGFYSAGVHGFRDPYIPEKTKRTHCCVLWDAPDTHQSPYDILYRALLVKAVFVLFLKVHQLYVRDNRTPGTPLRFERSGKNTPRT